MVIPWSLMPCVGLLYALMVWHQGEYPWLHTYGKGLVSDWVAIFWKGRGTTVLREPRGAFGVFRHFGTILMNPYPVCIVTCRRLGRLISGTLLWPMCPTGHQGYYCTQRIKWALPWPMCPTGHQGYYRYPRSLKWPSGVLPLPLKVPHNSYLSRVVHHFLT